MLVPIAVMLADRGSIGNKLMDCASDIVMVNLR